MKSPKRWSAEPSNAVLITTPDPRWILKVETASSFAAQETSPEIRARALGENHCRGGLVC